MQIVTVPQGQDAPDGADWIYIERLPSGAFQYTASVAVSPRDAIFNSGPFPTADLARSAGLEWAKQQGACEVYVADRSDAGN